MHFRALLSGNERRSQDAAVRFAGKIGGGDHRNDGWHAFSSMGK
jgi:hypothetical protein